MRFIALIIMLLMPNAALAQDYSFAPAPTSSQKAAISPVVGANVSTLAVKTAGNASNLYDAYITSTNAGYFFAFNSAVVPTNGSVTAGTASGNYQDCIYVPANTTQSLFVPGSPPESFSAGIYLAFSSTGCGTLTLVATAFMKARAQ